MRLPVRNAVILAHDMAAAALAWVLAYWLRFNLDIPSPYLHGMMLSLVWVVPLHGAIILFLGVYRGMWRYVSVKDLQRIVLAVALAAALATAVVFMFQLGEVPRSVLILQPVLLIVAMGGARFAYRAWREQQIYGRIHMEGDPVLILGAGDAAVMLLRELKHSEEWRVVGLLDDEVEKRGRSIDGVSVLGGLGEVADHAARLQLKHVIIAMPSAAAGIRRRAAESAAAAGLMVLTVPAIDDLLSGKVSVSQVRKVELEDLLGRDPIQLDDEGLHRLLTGKRVLVTGAGGSIGSELCRQIARYAPSRLVFFEQSEFALYRIEQEFAAELPEVGIVCVVGDVKDEASLAAAFAMHRPEVVFHAAAYKHVPLMENENAWAAVRNNVLGTWCVARAAMAAGVGKFVMVSTDKAVNPANVMGASKRLAEMVCQSLQTETRETHFVTVRFGNVLGSSGSVIPRFREQIVRGGPVTVTHPDIIRYFMLIPEAAQLVLQAGLMGLGGEIFVLDMGEPVKIVDLARDMIRLSGYSEEEVKIVFTGLRPGEKLFEELLADGEHTLPTPHPKLRIARAQAALSAEEMADLLAWLRGAPQEEQDVKQRLMRFVPEYRPRQTE
ncbi:polysaccharide biosynthesis protein [Candidatus Desulfobacillus denitrificans]|uniref:Polysaccharide biosynthesis protein n=1 Tax=Candidatus Desulfobacillus denitrificans TaxID=2608985 RepID=A0A809RTP5_9PROT|nr:polysaccharide biosynthesis protein [Candidatus Desulfobacillus denitrificans]GIK45746.1 MAG: nucleoside-diphosphate sugar oxidoreductase [Betaproteobacteria bacterium]